MFIYYYFSISVAPLGNVPMHAVYKNTSAKKQIIIKIQPMQRVNTDMIK